jgi:hypothetical protein
VGWAKNSRYGVSSITGAPSDCQSFLWDEPRARLIETATESKAIGAKSRENSVPSPRPRFIWAWRNDGTNAKNELTTAGTIPLETPLQSARTSVVFPPAEIGVKRSFDGTITTGYGKRSCRKPEDQGLASIPFK